MQTIAFYGLFWTNGNIIFQPDKGLLQPDWFPYEEDNWGSKVDRYDSALIDQS